MALGVAGATEAEGVTESFAEMPDEMNGIFEIRKPTVAGLLKSDGPVAAEGEDVFDAAFGKFFEDFIDVYQSLADASKMRHRFEAELFFDLECDFERAGARASAGAVGARGERRAQLAKVRQGFQQRRHRLVVFGREEFEGEGRFVSPEDVADFHLSRNFR